MELKALSEAEVESESKTKTKIVREGEEGESISKTETSADGSGLDTAGSRTGGKEELKVGEEEGKLAREQVERETGSGSRKEPPPGTIPPT